MTRWFVDIYDDDDPAVQMTREAERRFAESLTAPEKAPPRPDLPPVSPQARVSQLVARVRAGDLSAVDELRRLVGSHLDGGNPAG